MITKHLSNITLSLLALTLVSGSLLISSTTSAEDESVVDEVNISVPVSCSLSGTGMSSHTANIVNGTYQADIGTTTLKAFCNDNNGFAIYANGYTGDTLGNNKLIGSSTSSEIVTGTATTTGNPDVSNWAVKLATDSTATYPITLDNSFGAYSSVPSTYTKVAHRDSGTDLGSSATGASFTTTYAAYISKTQQADTYNGKVKYTLVHPASADPGQHEIECEAGKICYSPNTSTSIGQMGKQSASGNASVMLWAPNFKRTGYGFAGWNTAYDYSGTTYGPNETITTPADTSTNGLSLYAVWVPSAGTLQNWNGCSGLTQGTITALTDNRDNDTYAVAKLANDKCWTIENLRLDNVPELSSDNTHNPSLPLNNSWYYRNSRTTLTTSNHLSSPTYPAQTAWCDTSFTASCFNQSMLAVNNTALFINNSSSNYSASSTVYSYGNYYNWYSATAGHGKYGSDYGSSFTAPGDICPAGWHLPTGKNTTSDFGTLYTVLGGTGTYSNSSTTPTGVTMSLAYRSYPNNFTYNGLTSGPSANYNSNSYGSYWSSSGSTSSAVFSLYFHDDYVDPALYDNTYGANKYYGYAVRCVAGV